VAGTVTRDDGDATVLFFESGLFDSGADLTLAGGGLLDGLAANLSKEPDRLVITITGHTDDVPVPPGGRFFDNVSLGFARAAAVAQRLRSAARLGTTDIALRSLGSDQPPFPNDSREGRLRNRTVVIRIAERSGTESR